jgi:hypothetical protein
MQALDRFTAFAMTMDALAMTAVGRPSSRATKVSAAIQWGHGIGRT